VARFALCYTEYESNYIYIGWRVIKMFNSMNYMRVLRANLAQTGAFSCALHFGNIGPAHPRIHIPILAAATNTKPGRVAQLGMQFQSKLN
jgi:hypothetical protein